MSVHPSRRAVLVAPGSDAHKAAKAIASAADEVVLDLEDGVTSAHKVTAREQVVDIVLASGHARSLAVRVNSPGTPWFVDDLRACASLGPALSSIVVPKIESAAHLVQTARILQDVGDTNLQVQALIETPLGITNLDEITAGPRLAGVILGYADLGAALGRALAAGPQQWLYVQDRVLHSARAAGIAAIDGPFLSIADDETFRTAARWSADLGFDGKWVIHPSQVDTVLVAFTPDARQTQHAQRVLDALAEAEARGAGTAQLDGQMLDEAVAVAARRTLAKMGALRP